MSNALQIEHFDNAEQTNKFFMIDEDAEREFLVRYRDSNIKVIYDYKDIEESNSCIVSILFYKETCIVSDRREIEYMDFILSEETEYFALEKKFKSHFSKVFEIKSTPIYGEQDELDAFNSEIKTLMQRYNVNITPYFYICNECNLACCKHVLHNSINRTKFESLEYKKCDECYKPYGPDGLVYLLQNPSTKILKIGYTKNFSRRLKQLTHQCGEKLDVIKTIKGDRNTEKALHKYFEHRRRDQGEWFDYDDLIPKFFDDFVSVQDCESMKWENVPNRTTRILNDKFALCNDGMLIKGQIQATPLRFGLQARYKFCCVTENHDHADICFIKK